MDCREVDFTRHALTRMFERGIGRPDISSILSSALVVVEDYPNDQPYPSQLVLGWRGQEPLHIVVAFDKYSGLCIVVTAYIPDVAEWNIDWKTRKAQ